MTETLNYRRATLSDSPVLARMNQQLIRDEGHRNAMTLPELERRMEGWLAGEYEAVIVLRDGEPIGYALFRREPDHVYLRQLFVAAEFRRQGLGRAALRWLRENAWESAQRVRVEVLIGNAAGLAFWRACGFRDYCVTLEADA